MMKSRDTLVRLKRFHVEEKRRRLAQIESMINEFARMAADLDREIALEEQRAGISDLTHFALSDLCASGAARRDDPLRSIANCVSQLEDAKATQTRPTRNSAKFNSRWTRKERGTSTSARCRTGDSLGDLGLRAAQA